jgi:hypothetical protein
MVLPLLFEVAEAVLFNTRAYGPLKSKAEVASDLCIGRVLGRQPIGDNFSQRIVSSRYKVKHSLTVEKNIEYLESHVRSFHRS